MPAKRGACWRRSGSRADGVASTVLNRRRYSPEYPPHVMTMRRGEFRQVTLGFVALCIGIFVTACDTSRDSAKPSSLDVGRARFQTAIALPSRTYRVYWLGNSLTASGLVLRGPLIGGFEEPLDDAVRFDYNSVPPVASLSITLMSSAQWAAVRDRVLRQGPDHPTTRQLTVASAAATLYTTPGGTGRPVGALSLIIQLGDTVVYASTSSVGAATPGGPEANPLIDEATFLGVMQNLRPYPQ